VPLSFSCLIPVKIWFFLFLPCLIFGRSKVSSSALVRGSASRVPTGGSGGASTWSCHPSVLWPFNVSAEWIMFRLGSSVARSRRRTWLVFHLPPLVSIHAPRTSFWLVFLAAGCPRSAVRGSASAGRFLPRLSSSSPCQPDSVSPEHAGQIHQVTIFLPSA
jgi:hypothetical protein